MPWKTLLDVHKAMQMWGLFLWEMCSTIWRPRKCVYPSVFIPSLPSIRHPNLGNTVCISPKENSEKVWVFTLASSWHYTIWLPQLPELISSKARLFQFLAAKISCQFLSPCGANVWRVLSPFKASVRFPLQREIVQLASEGSTIFFTEVVCVCKACR